MPPPGPRLEDALSPRRRIRYSLTPWIRVKYHPRLMRRIGVAVLCAAFLVGMLEASPVHVHPATEHQHGAQDQHHHESLFHAHIPGSRDSDPRPHVADRDHGPDEATAIYLPCRSVTPKAPSAVPGASLVIVGECDDPARRSSLELSRVTHPRAGPYLIGPGPRAPPA